MTDDVPVRTVTVAYRDIDYNNGSVTSPERYIVTDEDTVVVGGLAFLVLSNPVETHHIALDRILSWSSQDSGEKMRLTTAGRWSRLTP